MDILKVIMAIVTFVISLILVKVFVWDILDTFITLGANICGSQCTTLTTIGTITQYLITIGMLIFPPLMVLQGKMGDKLKAMVKL